MKKEIILPVSILFFVIGAALVFIAPSFSTPKFVMTNHTENSVSLVARWRDIEKDVGVLLAGESTELQVSDEASIEIAATFPNGETVSSMPVYFTAGMVYKIDIYNDRIETAFE